MADEEKESSGVLVKAIAGVFVTVLAPVLVAVGMKYSDRIVEALPALPANKDAAAKKDDSPKSAESAKNLGTASATSPFQTDAFASVTLGAPERLFLSNHAHTYYTYLGSRSESGKPLGKDNDQDKVFAFRGNTMHVSGKLLGIVCTKAEYADYLLSLEFKWGQHTYGSREKMARTSGVMLHCTGPDGEIRQAFPVSMKCALVEGATGDLNIYGGKPSKVSLSAAIEKCEFGDEKHHRLYYCYKPNEPVTTLGSGILRRHPTDFARLDETGYHGKTDIEKPTGEWNTLECLCIHDRITVRLNGKVVNDATTNLTHGKIALQSNQAEIYFRNISLRPVTTKP